MKAHMVFFYNTHTHSSRHIEKWTCNKKGEINLQIAFKNELALYCAKEHTGGRTRSKSGFYYSIGEEYTGLCSSILYGEQERPLT